MEDNDISRKILVRWLKSRLRSNVKVETVVDGLRGIEVFKRVHPQVVFDILMLKMDGIYVAVEMRKVEMAKMRPHARIYAITAWDHRTFIHVRTL